MPSLCDPAMAGDLEVVKAVLKDRSDSVSSIDQAF
jgi:hypothetical protein